MNLSNEPEQEYLADGITEELITDLSYAQPLRVLSRSSTIRFKGSHLSVAEIAKQLNVDALIEGTVLRAGYIDTDLSISKTFSIERTTALQFRGEIFNTFNNVNMSAPTSNMSSPAFGTIPAAGAPRIVQLALRLSF